MTPVRRARLDGLDLARYLALAGMVLVNFRLAMQPRPDGPPWLQALFDGIEGKASAVFVVLAGLGLSLATRDQAPGEAWTWTVRRAMFLMAVGLLNQLVFPADIIHYYAVYFLLALPWLHAGKEGLYGGVLGVASVSLWAQLNFDYARGWDWHSLRYDGFWTWGGFVRNLLFNGFHPVLPWLALFLYGMLLGQFALPRARMQWMLMAGGALAMGAASGVAWLGEGTVGGWLVSTAPMPPGPVYLLMGVGVASVAIGASLRIAGGWPGGPWRALLPAGRMTLSLYLAHILLGMSTLQALGALDGSWTLSETAAAASVFVACGTVFAWAWSRVMPQGPVETLMRKVTSVSWHRGSYARRASGKRLDES
ncbi:Predicted membrane protein [Bordetella ansorpii]|uniref:Predicted membrane protein n=1 Tax=Bordetella ansorpii TaxID=288768 RepID=A0A157SGF0_9BORD|nr:heparan-alpha-glucosaminide N-acetyltransferase domain-containing protein [Bordetella ansorpii]SAI69552.1 Predicted membrane protein [Bordetella ansorpii]